MGADFRVEGNKVIMVFGVNDVFNNTKTFKTHREYIQSIFRQHGYEVIKWNWDKDPASGKWREFKDGITFMSMDRLVDMSLEVHGEIGKNVRTLMRDEDVIHAT